MSQEEAVADPVRDLRNGASTPRGRKNRVAAGAAGGGGAVILANCIVVFWGQKWDASQVAAIVSLIAWVGTWGSICAFDVRSILLARLKRRSDD